MKVKTWAKAAYAAVMAGILAAQVIYVGNPYITIAVAVLTAVGVYVIPNSPDTEPLDKGHDTP